MTREALLAELADRILHVERPHPVRVAVDGVDAAGKTTLADALAARLANRGRAVVRASIDDFLLPSAVRHRRGDLSGEGYYRDAFDLAALERHLLAPLGLGGTLRYRASVFDAERDAPVESAEQRAPPDATLLLDGVFLHRPELRGHFDLSIFLRASFEATLRRARSRDAARFGDAATLERRYRERYVPGQRLYLAEVDPEAHASIVIDHEDPDAPRIVRG